MGKNPNPSNLNGKPSMPLFASPLFSKVFLSCVSAQIQTPNDAKVKRAPYAREISPSPSNAPGI